MQEWLKGHQKEALVLAAGLLIVGMGIVWRRTETAREETTVQLVKEAGEELNQEGLVVVDIAGAVNKAGVYRLPGGSRVDEAIAAAGGWTETADKEWISKYLNRSAKVSDGQKIYIPKADGAAAVNDEDNSPGLININQAGTSALDSLPGVGAVTAGKIISGRPYQRIEELNERKIVGDKVWEQIRTLISVY